MRTTPTPEPMRTEVTRLKAMTHNTKKTIALAMTHAAMRRTGLLVDAGLAVV
jgi:hypothetical protein